MMLNKTCKKNHSYNAELRQCPECKKAWQKSWYSTHSEGHKERVIKNRKAKPKKYLYSKEYIAAASRKYYLANRESILDKAKLKLITPAIRAKRTLYANRKRKSDFAFRLAENLRSRINHAVRKGSKSGSAIKDLGCSVEFLKMHLESQFQPSMNWDNYGKYGWHIDHIIPLAKFDLTRREELLRACHYTNLQPLWAKDNLKKGASYGL